MGIRRVDKPWGYELIWAETERYVGKVLHIREGQRLSLQYHTRKDETIYLQSGRLLMIAGAESSLVETEMKPGDARHIPPLTRHRMIAVTDCDIFEVSTPELQDVVRLEDSYGRAGTNDP